MELAPDRVSVDERTRTPTEEIVASIWAEELRLPHIGLDEDFIDLGSHSLQGVSIVARLEEIFRVSIPIRVLFEEPTVADLAAWIDRQNGVIDGSQAEMVRLQEGSGLRPIFVVPPGHGGPRALFALAKLGRETDPRRPFYGFPGDPPVPAGTARDRWVQAAATSLNNVMRMRQRNGPYLLLGSCVGGLIAWEMAHQLQESGETVHLFLVDTRHPRLRSDVNPLRRAVTKAWWWARSVINRKVLIIVSWRLQFEYLRQRGQLPWESASPDEDSNTRNAVTKSGRRRLVMTRKYRPKPLMGRVKLLANTDWFRSNPTLGWGTLIDDRLDVAVMSKEHLLHWNYKEVAAWLRAELEKVDPEP